MVITRMSFWICFMGAIIKQMIRRVVTLLYKVHNISTCHQHRSQLRGIGISHIWMVLFMCPQYWSQSGGPGTDHIWIMLSTCHQLGSESAGTNMDHIWMVIFTCRSRVTGICHNLDNALHVLPA